MPSHKKIDGPSPRIPSKVKRGTPRIGSKPMVEIISPRPPAMRPLTMFPPLSDPTKVIARRASMKNSGEPMERTSGAAMGIASAKTKAPKMAPTRELISAAPKARPASPFLAIG